jgi:hypothetical protein
MSDLILGFALGCLIVLGAAVLSEWLQLMALGQFRGPYG